MQIQSILKRVQLFAGLSIDDLDQLAAICTEVTCPPEDIIIHQSTTGTEMYIIAEGEVEVFIQGGDDAIARSLVLLGEGQVFGEMALIDQGHRSASIRARKRGCLLYKMERDAFYQLCETGSKIGFLVMRNLAIDIAFKLRHRNLTGM